MPVEIRSILLSRDELLQAVDAYRRASGDVPGGDITYRPAGPGGILDGDLVTCEPDPNSGLKLTIRTNQGDQQRTVNIKIKPEELVEILISFCIDHQIPIPKHGRKSYTVSRDRVGLLIRIEP